MRFLVTSLRISLMRPCRQTQGEKYAVDPMNPMVAAVKDAIILLPIAEPKFTLPQHGTFRRAAKQRSGREGTFSLDA